MNMGIIAQATDIRHWLETHAEAVAAVQPTWSDPARTWVDLDFVGEEAVSIRFVGVLGPIEVSQWADIRGTTMVLRGKPKLGTVLAETIDDLTLAELHRLASIMGTSVTETYGAFVAVAA